VVGGHDDVAGGMSSKPPASAEPFTAPINGVANSAASARRNPSVASVPPFESSPAAARHAVHAGAERFVRRRR